MASAVLLAQPTNNMKSMAFPEEAHWLQHLHRAPVTVKLGCASGWLGLGQ